MIEPPETTQTDPSAPSAFDGQALLDAISRIARDLDVNSVLTHIVEAATALTGARYGALGVLTPDGKLGELFTTGISEKMQDAIGMMPHGGGLLGVITEEARTLRLPDMSVHPAAGGLPAGHPPMRSFLGMPIRIRGTVFGNLYLTEKEAGADFTAEDERLVEALARTAGYAIGNARDYEISEQRRLFLEASAELQDTLRPPIEVDVALQRITATTKRITRGQAVALLAQDPTEADTVTAEADLLGRVSEALDVIRSSTAHPPTSVATLDVSGFAATIVPLHSPLAPVSALVVFVDPRARSMYSSDRELLATFADQALLAFDRSQAMADREQLALTSDRERIARDLHDVVIQRLFATGIHLQAIAPKAGDAEVVEQIDRAAIEMDAIIKAIRGSIFELQHHGSGSLRDELRQVVRGYTQLLGFAPEMTTSGPIDTLVSPRMADQVLAVLREAVSNVARHARCTRAQITVEATQHDLTLRVVDNGVGLPEDRHESGLRNSRGRARDLGGTLDLSPGPDGGTMLTWIVPLV